MKKVILTILVMFPVISISLAAQSALAFEANCKQEAKGGPGDGFSAIVIGTGNDDKTKK